MTNKSNCYVACTHLHARVETLSTYLCSSSPHPPHKLLTPPSLFHFPTPPGALHPEPMYQKYMALGPYLAYDGVEYECTICERFFEALNLLFTPIANRHRDMHGVKDAAGCSSQFQQEMRIF